MRGVGEHVNGSLLWSERREADVEMTEDGQEVEESARVSSRVLPVPVYGGVRRSDRGAS